MECNLFQSLQAGLHRQHQLHVLALKLQDCLHLGMELGPVDLGGQGGGRVGQLEAARLLG